MSIPYAFAHGQPVNQKLAGACNLCRINPVLFIAKALDQAISQGFGLNAGTYQHATAPVTRAHQVCPALRRGPHLRKRAKALDLYGPNLLKRRDFNEGVAASWMIRTKI